MTVGRTGQAELARFFDELEAWASTRAGPTETLAYGEHEDQVLDLRVPREPRRTPLALVLHGGFWRAPFTRGTTTALAVGLTEAGWTTANVEYRRLGPGAYGAMLEDVAAARRRLATFETVVAIGHSAGGQLALWLAAEGLVDAVVTLGGVCDLRAAAEAGLGDNAVTELLGGSPADVPAAYREADPATRLPLGRRQILVHGRADDRVPIGHAECYAARARLAGDDCRVVALDAGHFTPIDPRAAPWPHVLDAVAGIPSDPGYIV